MLRNRCYRFVHGDRGSSLIELAVILPMLVLMLLAVLDFGLVLRQDMMVADSARAGAEYALNRVTTSDTAGMKSVATASAGNIPGYQAVAVVACTCGPGGVAVACSGTCVSYGNPAQYAQVTATASLPLIYNVAGFPAQISVKSVASIRIPFTAGN